MSEASSGVASSSVNRVPELAPRKAVRDGCAAHDWGQVLVFEGKSCSHLGAFTTSIMEQAPPPGGQLVFLPLRILTLLAIHRPVDWLDFVWLSQQQDQ